MHTCHSYDCEEDKSEVNGWGHCWRLMDWFNISSLLCWTIWMSHLFHKRLFIVENCIKWILSENASLGFTICPPSLILLCNVYCQWTKWVAARKRWSLWLQINVGMLNLFKRLYLRRGAQTLSSNGWLDKISRLLRTVLTWMNWLRAGLELEKQLKLKYWITWLPQALKHIEREFLISSTNVAWSRYWHLETLLSKYPAFKKLFFCHRLHQE